MLKHIVLWRLKESAHGNDKATNARLLKEKLEALRGQIPGLLAIEVGVDVMGSPFSSDIALYSEFSDRDALAVYQAHPLHQAILPFAAEAVLERRSVDYEL